MPSKIARNRLRKIEGGADLHVWPVERVPRELGLHLDLGIVVLDTCLRADAIVVKKHAVVVERATARAGERETGHPAKLGLGRDSSVLFHFLEQLLMMRK